MNPNIPYPPKSVVYFIVEDAIRKGVVQSVYCKLTNQGEEQCWNILEYLTEAEPVNWSVHSSDDIASTAESIILRADSTIPPYKIANKIAESKAVAEDIFE